MTVCLSSLLLGEAWVGIKKLQHSYDHPLFIFQIQYFCSSHFGFIPSLEDLLYVCVSVCLSVVEEWETLEITLNPKIDNRKSVGSKILFSVPGYMALTFSQQLSFHAAILLSLTLGRNCLLKKKKQ